MERNGAQKVSITGSLIMGMAIGSMISALLATWITLYYIDRRLMNVQGAPQQAQCGGEDPETENESTGNTKA